MTSKGILQLPYTAIVLILLLAALLLSIVILSGVPPVSRDELTHHLAIPKLYLKHGGIYEIPHVVFSYYPMNIDLLYLIPLYFGNDIAPKFIHFFFALLTAWLIFQYLIKRTDLNYALLGVLFFLSIPIIVKLSITAYVDLGLTFFSTAAIIYIFKWMEDSFRLRHLILSGCCCGLALGAKYNGLVVLLLLTLFVPFIYMRSSKGHSSGQFRAAGFGIIFMLTALLLFSPWMIRNHLWKQNPIYPLYHHWFSSNKAPDFTAPSGEADAGPGMGANTVPAKAPKRLGLFAYRQIAFNESWWQIALVPVRIFFTGRDDDPRYFDGKLTPFLMLLPLLAFIGSAEKRPRQHTEKRLLLLFSLLFVLIAFFTIEMRIRYLVPMVPPLVMLSISGLHQLNALTHGRYPVRAKTISAALTIAIAGMMLLIHAGYIWDQFGEVRPFDYLRGRVGRDAYIEAYRKEYPVLQYANQNLAENAQILSIFLGNRIYYSDRTMRSDVGLFLNAVKRSETSRKIADDLRKKGLTHAIIRMDLFESWINNNLNQKQKEMVQLFFKSHMKLLFFKNGYGLFKIENIDML